MVDFNVHMECNAGEGTLVTNLVTLTAELCSTTTQNTMEIYNFENANYIK